MASTTVYLFKAFLSEYGCESFKVFLGIVVGLDGPNIIFFLGRLQALLTTVVTFRNTGVLLCLVYIPISNTLGAHLPDLLLALQPETTLDLAALI
jgi:hypothetical protein